MRNPKVEKLVDRRVIFVNGTDFAYWPRKLVALVRKTLGRPAKTAVTWLSPAAPVPGSTSPHTHPTEATAAPDHALYRRLCERVPADRIHRFEWNGRNSDDHRLAAASALADDIEPLLNSSNDIIFVVAHSHGGNVALYARKDLARRVNPAALKRLRIVTLSTPFLHVFDEKVGDVFWKGVLPSTLILATWYAFEQRWPTQSPFPIGLATAGLVLWLVTSVIGWLLYRPMWSKPSARLSERLEALRHDQLEEKSGVVVVRTTADEAEGVLIAALLASWLGLLFTKLDEHIKVTSGILIVLLFVTISGIAGSWIGEGIWIWLLPAVFFLIMLGSVLRWSITALGLGLKHSPLIWFYGTSAEAIPEGRVRSIQTPRPTAAGLAHSSYARAECIDTVCEIVSGSGRQTIEPNG